MLPQTLNPMERDGLITLAAVLDGLLLYLTRPVAQRRSDALERHKRTWASGIHSPSLADNATLAVP